MSRFNTINRRGFLLTAANASLGALAPPGLQAKSTLPSASSDSPALNPYSPAELFKLGPQRTFSGEHAAQVAMPIGGLGTGCVCLNGQGGLQDFSIRHHPSTTALSTQHNYGEAAFATLRIKEDSSVTRVIEGPMPPFRIYDQGLQGQGYLHGGHEGFPRFAKASFQGEYPFGRVFLTDPNLPVQVELTGWNPFIPLDDKNSGLPGVILEYKLQNHSSQMVKYEFSYHLSHLAAGCAPAEARSRSKAIPGEGIFFFNIENPHAEGFGTACLLMLNHQPKIKAMWLRSPAWPFDALSALWKEISSGQFAPNEGSNAADQFGRNGGSMQVDGELLPGQSITYPILIAWHFPNSYLKVGGIPDPQKPDPTGAPGCRSLPQDEGPYWRPYYISLWKNAEEVAAYIAANYSSLRARTLAFKEALFSSTFPPYVLDAISANLGILKSPTVLRQENGNLWAWEGCFPDSGCCHGSCTHVWNYAQALPHLFPQLERTLREQELERSMDEKGHVTFRAALPDGPVKHDFHAAADGQLGGIMKVYREWQISGDFEWLKKMYPLAKRSLEFSIGQWDPERRGALVEPHHNTYDIEFWGPDSLCTSIYLGALSAMAEMAQAMGNREEADQFGALAQTCARYLDVQLFNGEYYQQKIQYEGLRDKSFISSIAKVDQNSSEMQRLLKKEGPKYQYGSGCLSDGVIGAWMACCYGIEIPLSRSNLRKTLLSIFRHNFKKDLSAHANAQRPGYALGREPGLLLCSWPRGGKPTLPFVYSDEVWTGIEYQVASHLIAEGFVAEGLSIVKATRSRYNGRVRNPWNEYECGNYYARAMASYALLAALSGFRYSAVSRTLWLAPKLEYRPFRTFFSTATGFGTLQINPHSVEIHLAEGKLLIKSLHLELEGRLRELKIDTVVKPEKVVILSWG